MRELVALAKGRPGDLTFASSGVLPDLPTIDEAGVKGYESVTFNGLSAPAGSCARSA